MLYKIIKDERNNMLFFKTYHYVTRVKKRQINMISRFNKLNVAYRYGMIRLRPLYYKIHTCHPWKQAEKILGRILARVLLI